MHVALSEKIQSIEITQINHIGIRDDDSALSRISFATDVHEGEKFQKFTACWSRTNEKDLERL